jgi:hypothetical protein
MSTSIVCLIGVIIAYLWVPALNDLTGKAVMGLACSLLAMYSFLVLEYLETFVGITTNENMEAISFLCCGIWLILMCGNICLNVWYYLTINARMTQPRVQRIFLGTAIFSVTVFVALSAIFTDSKTT